MREQELIIAKQHFHEDMLKIFKRTAKEVKYKPTRRLDLMNKYGGYEAAIKILPTDSNTFDFTLLWEQERLDLSIEALVTKERYSYLFPDEVVAFCQKRLDEYNYAPKKLEIEEDAIDALFESLIGNVDLEPKVVQEELNEIEVIGAKVITEEEWEEIFLKDTVFTSSHRDLMLSIYALGNQIITVETLANLEGYSKTYPFFDVIVTLCKRIKNALKLETPYDQDNKPVWWSILFRGEAEDKKSFKWQLNQSLTDAIRTLMEKGLLPMIEVAVKKTDVVADTTQDEIQLGDSEINQDHNESEIEQEQIEEIEEVEEIATPDVIPVEAAKSHTPDDVSVPVEVSTPVEVFDLEKELAEMAKEASLKKAMEEKIQEESAPKSQEAINHVAREEAQPNIVAEEIKTAQISEHLVNTEVRSFNELEATYQIPLKEACLSYYGSACDLCGFDFGYTYGDAFEQFVEIYCEDTSKLDHPETINPEEDLVPICANCKSVMAHNYTIKQLRELVENNR